MKFDENFIFKLKSNCDIGLIFSSYVELKKVGAYKRCCCPFHTEKTPSCFVYENTQSFYCYGCGVGGDVITFIEKIENLSYFEAVKFLANKAGLELPSENFDGELIKKKELLYEINKVAALYYYRNLGSLHGMAGLNYLKTRGLKSFTVTKFGIGYALDDWTGLFKFLKLKGYSKKEILESGLVIKSKTGKLIDKFRNRLMFPIVNCFSKVIGFGGRLLSGSGPKYLNSSESVVFKKGYELYGLNFFKNVKKVDSLILCEGYMDVVTLHQHGFLNCVATLGTSLTKNQVLLLSRFCKEVVIAYDSDSAGLAAGLKALNLLGKAGIRIRILTIKGAKDPDEFLNKFGAARFKNALTEALNYEGFLFRNLKEDYASADFETKRQLIHKTCLHIAKVTDLIKRDILIRKICNDLNLAYSIIKKHVTYLTKKNNLKLKKSLINLHKQNTTNSVGKVLHSKSAPLISYSGVEKAQAMLLKMVFLFPAKFKALFEEVDDSYFDNSIFLKKVFNIYVKLKNSNLKFSLNVMRNQLNEREFYEFNKLINFDEFLHESCSIDSFDEKLFMHYIKILKTSKFKLKRYIAGMSAQEMELIRLKKAQSKC